MRSAITTIILIFLFSCGNQENMAMQLQDSIEAADSVYAAVKAAKYERLNELRDSLIDAAFIYNEDGSYEHKYLAEAMLVRENALSVSISIAYNEMNFISKVTPGTDWPHNQLFVTNLKDTAWAGESTSSNINHISAGNYETVTFSDYSDPNVGQFIVSRPGTPIFVCAMNYNEVVARYELTDNDRKAISDCILLYNIQRELSEVDSYYY